MFLDDDDCLTHNKVLNIINDNLEENKILKWKFLRPDKIIYSENNKINLEKLLVVVLYFIINLKINLIG